MSKGITVSFWGVRGSVSSAGKKTVKYGGNTLCLMIEHGRTRIICDAGTGIRPLGEALKRSKKPLRATIMLTHLHWDHFTGLPFFEPLYQARNRFVIAGPGQGRVSFKTCLDRVLSPPYFPIRLDDLVAKIDYRTIREKPFSIDDIMVIPYTCNHPGGSFGWRFEFPNGKSIIYVSDNEPSLRNRDRMLAWMRDAEMVIHDAQYSPANYARHRGWGHSPYTYPVQMSIAANAKRLFLYHYDPATEDSRLESWLSDARKVAGKYRSKLKVYLSREGKTIAL